jgi:hypothetical protein
MDDRIYVVAGTRAEFEEYVRLKMQTMDVSPSLFVWAFESMRIRGVSNPHGVFIGSWRNLPNVKDLVQQMVVQSNPANPALMRIWGELHV